MSQKTYILDTNVLMSDPYAIDKFEDNKVVIPLKILQELDSHKTDIGIIGYNSRKALKNIESSNKVEFRESISSNAVFN